MKSRVFKLLMVVTVCGLWGCASSKPVQTGAADTQPAVDPNPPQPPVADPKRTPVPAKSSTPASKPAAASADVPKRKSNNEVAPQHQTIAPKEAQVAPIDAHGRPVEMKVANGFDKNPYLASVLKPIVPQRSTLTQSAMGFKNQREFITALHLSRNLVIPFDQIKIRITGDHRMSLSDSLRDIRPSLSKSMSRTPKPST